MIRLLIVAVIGIAIGLFISKLLSKKQHDDVIHGEVIDADARQSMPSLVPILLLGVLLVSVLIFVLPRFGVSLISLFQKAITFLPLIRGFLSF